MTPDQILAHFKRLTATFSPRQLATMGVVFVSVVALVAGSAYWVNTPTYTLLYTDLDAESAAAVVERLKAAKVPYQLEDGSRTVRVPANRVDELRLDMAAQGLPTAGRIGFEVFDRTAFGSTEFLEHVNYRRGLEGELARTISTLREVASARVHIAPAKDSLFVGERQEAKASVVLRLRNQAPLAPATVMGIAGLVANSVESLRPESVVIVDTFGRPLSRVHKDESEDSGASPERQRRVEQDLVAQVTALLEPVVGVGHVRVNVSARLDTQSQEETEERWDPNVVVRSHQSSSDGAAPATVQGIAGARANAPPGTTTGDAPVPEAVRATTTTPAGRFTETTNYEVSRLTRHTIVPQGKLSRLSVAVILDDERTSTKNEAGEVQVVSKPRSPDSLERIQRLVAAAVGLEPERGDQLTVENIAFGDVPTAEETPQGPAWMEVPRQMAPYAPQALRTLSVLLIAVLAIVMILRPMMRAALPGAVPAFQPALADGVSVGGGGGQAVRTVAEMEGAIEAELDAVLGPGEDRKLPVLTRRIARRADETPDEVAKMVRSWLNEGER